MTDWLNTGSYAPDSPEDPATIEASLDRAAAALKLATGAGPPSPAGHPAPGLPGRGFFLALSLNQGSNTPHKEVGKIS